MKKAFVILTICLITLCGIFATETVIVSVANDRNKRDLENVYKSSVLSLGDCLDNLEVNMSKITVASGTRENRELITDTYRQAETAAECISYLPLSFENITSTTKFFNQVGDWCLSFMRAIDDNKNVDKFVEQSDDIYKTASLLSQKFREIEEDIEQKGVYSSIGKDRILPVDFEGLFTDGMHSSVDYPALIYDGPFSDGKTYDFRALRSLPEITQREAEKIAAEKFGMTVEHVFLTVNKTDVFYLGGKIGDAECSLMLTKKGGVPIMMDKSAAGSGAEAADEEDAEKDSFTQSTGREFYEQEAVKYMQKLGFENLKAVWYNPTEGAAVINLAPETDGVIYYTDLVKVKVGLPDGEIKGFECSGYCEKNTDRALSPAISESDARAKVSKKLTVKNVRLCVIPIGEKEKFCYEFAAGYNDLDYFVYIDAESGGEVNILRVVDNKQGSMTM